MPGDVSVVSPHHDNLSMTPHTDRLQSCLLLRYLRSTIYYLLLEYAIFSVSRMLYSPSECPCFIIAMI